MDVAVSCRRPDGQWCNHPEAQHESNAELGNYQYMLGVLCRGCWKERGYEGIGPSLHKYNPHILTEAGWLPIDKES